MKLAVSNIAWDTPEQPDILAMLTAGGVAGVEIAPTKLWPDWQGATAEDAALIRKDFAARGFAVPALQSILFGRPDLHVFGDPNGLVDHIAGVAALAGGLGAAVMVFGSPRNRLRGALSQNEAMRQAVPIFRDIGAACAAAGTSLCIEANPAEYGGDFLLGWREAAELVALVDHPGIGLHFDTACTAMAGDDPVAALTECAGIIRHFHVSAPRLGPVGKTDGSIANNAGLAGLEIDHAALGGVLRAAGYLGWVSIEMRRTDTPVHDVARAAAFARGHYG